MDAHDRSHTTTGKWVKHTRWALLKAPDRQSLDQLATLGEVYQRNQRLYRAFLLYHQLRLLYALKDPALAPAHLDAWLRWAARSRLAPFVKAARTLRRHRAGVLAAIRLGLSNGRLEGLNSRVRLISHRSFGFHCAAPLIALIYLCCGGITINLPLRSRPLKPSKRPFYRAPEALVHQRVELRWDRDRVWIEHHGNTVASYPRSYEHGLWLPAPRMRPEPPPVAQLVPLPGPVVVPPALSDYAELCA